MTIPQINNMLARLDAVRAVFDVGPHSLPFLEEVAIFLKEISPLLEQINDSIRDSTSTMPRATTQLESVSHATEIAATEILDLVDAATARLGEIKACSEQGIRREQALMEADEHLMETLRSGLAGRDEELLTTVERLHADRGKMRAQHVELSSSVADTVADVRGMLCRITTSLQVQDITSQQIAAVSHSIESIRRRMNILAQHLNTEGSRLGMELHDPETRASFDPDARYDRPHDDQAIADAVFGGNGTRRKARQEPHEVGIGLPVESLPDSEPTGHTPGDRTTQDEIDRLFGNAG